MRSIAPWAVDCGDHTNGWCVIVDADGVEIGSCDGGFEEDDAALIAAAPALESALVGLCTRLQELGMTDGDYFRDLYAAAQEALLLASPA